MSECAKLRMGCGYNLTSVHYPVHTDAGAARHPADSARQTRRRMRDRKAESFGGNQGGLIPLERVGR